MVLPCSPTPVLARDEDGTAPAQDWLSADDLRGVSLLATPVWVVVCETRQVVYANAAARRLWRERVHVAAWPLVEPEVECGCDEPEICAIPEALLGDLDAGTCTLALGQVVHDCLTLALPGLDIRVIDCTVTGVRLAPNGDAAAVIEGSVRSTALPVAGADGSWQGEAALSYTSLMVTLFDGRGQAVYQNPAARAAFGDESLGLPLFHARFPDTHQAVEAWVSIRQGRVFRAETPVRTARGVRWHALEARLTGSAKGDEEPFVLVTEQDISEHVQNQSSLRETVERLARSNTELEQFAWITSHDLREPLRTVVSYITLLERHLGDSLDKTGQEFMDFAVAGARRMDVLTRDLLQYASIGRSPNPRQPVNLAALVATLLAQHRKTIDDCGATISCGPLPTVPGDLSELTLLFNNLLDNALKYRKPDTPLQVSIVAEREAQAWMIAVIDNGQGIDPRYFDRIFQIFQRLHTHDVTPGTGVGLALCRKIVERHGGRIWLESGVGRGAAFFLTLPVV